MAKELLKRKTDKYNKILEKSSINDEVKADKLTKEEKEEIKAYAIKKVLKLKKYVRN